ncbi:hypothetical protein ACFQ4K_29245 [Tistrella bauzanensis]
MPEWAAAQAAAAAAAGLTLTPPNANELVLDLLATHDAHSLPLRPLLRAGGLFGFSDQTIRVALSRLKRDGRVVTTARGIYALPPGGSLLMREVEGWGPRKPARSPGPAPGSRWPMAGWTAPTGPAAPA